MYLHTAPQRELQGTQQKPSGCDSTRKGTSVLSPENQADWLVRLKALPARGRGKETKACLKQAVQLLWKVTVFPCLTRKLLLCLMLSIWVLQCPLMIQLKRCAPPLNWQSQRQLPAGQHSKFTALTPPFDNTKPHASAKFPTATQITFLSPHQHRAPKGGRWISVANSLPEIKGYEQLQYVILTTSSCGLPAPWGSHNQFCPCGN